MRTQTSHKEQSQLHLKARFCFALLPSVLTKGDWDKQSKN